MAQLIDGKAISKEVLQNVADELKLINEIEAAFRPGLAIVQVGDRSDSNVYIRNKIARSDEVGVDARLIKLNRKISQEELERKIRELNADDTVDGIIVQLPLDCDNKIDADYIVDLIDQAKDVDGLTRENAGRLMRGELEKTIFPCTPFGCLHLVQKSTGNPDYVKGKHVVVIGRSKIVGSPAAALFMWHHGTTTICHSRTANLKEHCLRADILVVAIGQEKLIKGDWVKPGSVVIDCGINVRELPTGKRQLLGDVDFEEAQKVASFITPVPGGVGPMTVAMLVRNTFQQAVNRRLNKESSIPRWNLQALQQNIEGQKQESKT
ncbi:Methenyltetrahydrofolate cyclohydrolase [Aphelenchoides bicaudatus]|nr:Methenyltetrahydrofolate cyclohydrolase [Aphelenchoides bicaudatus]